MKKPLKSCTTLSDVLWSTRCCIIKFAKIINRKTSFLDGLKNRLSISNAILRILVPTVKASKAKEIKENLNTHYIEERVLECSRRNLTPEFWIVLTWSMGDIVACEPISRHLKKIAPAAKVHWIVLKQFSEILEANPFIDDIIAVNTLTEGKTIAHMKASSNKRSIIVDCHFDGTSDPATNQIFDNPINPNVNIHTYYSIGSLLETFSAAAGLPMLNDAPIFHLRKGIAPPFTVKNAAIVHCCASETCRNWDVNKWNLLAEQLTQKGFSVVEIGTERMLKQMPNIIDYTGHKSIQQLAAIIKSAALFVGVDSVFAHVANALQTHSVILLGKFRNFIKYFPYSGDFANSPSFQIVQAPENKPASEISVVEVLNAIQSLIPNLTEV